MSLIKYFRSRSKCSSENPLSSADITNTTKERRIPVHEKVFQNPVILQVILKHVLQKRRKTERKNSNQKDQRILCTQTAKRLRLVCSAWLVEVNLLFRKAGQPFIFLTFQNLPKFLNSTKNKRNNWVPPLRLSLFLDTFSFKCISLPRIITRMEMCSRLSLATLVLRRSDILEEMRVLKLNIITRNNLVDKEDLHILSRCLNQWALSLEELELGIDWPIFHQNRDLQVALNFPRMTNLKKMKILGNSWRLDKNDLQDDLGGRLPKLEELKFRQISGDIFFGEWCRSSVFWSVSSLALYLLTDSGEYHVRSVIFSRENMEQILGSFPQLVHLQLGLVDPQELNGLRYIFGKMGQLRSLELNIVGEITLEEEIDGLLIGAGLEMVRRLKGDSALWGRFLDGDLGDEGKYTSSIRDLKMLESLVLQGDLVKINEQGRVRNVPSDLAFELGFMKLPELRRLVLEGSFGVSGKMADKWRKEKEGREIVTKGSMIGWIGGWIDMRTCFSLLVCICFNLMWGWCFTWKEDGTWLEAVMETGRSVVIQVLLNRLL